MNNSSGFSLYLYMISCRPTSLCLLLYTSHGDLPALLACWNTFCACDRTCASLLVPTACAIFLAAPRPSPTRSLPVAASGRPDLCLRATCLRRASRKRACSSGDHILRLLEKESPLSPLSPLSLLDSSGRLVSSWPGGCDGGGHAQRDAYDGRRGEQDREAGWCSAGEVQER